MLQQRRPRLHTLDQLGTSIGHDISSAAATALDGNVGTTSSLLLVQNHQNGDDETPRHRKHWSLRASWQRNRRLLLYRYAPMAIVSLSVILTVTRTLGIRLRAPRTVSGASFSQPTDLVYPPPTVQISVIVMNHARPNLLQHSKLLPTLLLHPTVAEILILHSNPATAFTTAALSHYGADVSTDKIRHVNAVDENLRLGLAIRFFYCSTETAHDWVLLVDDDMELDATTVTDLVTEFGINSRRIVGHYGRTYNYWAAPFRHGYDTKNIFGSHVEVVLTKLLLLERQVCTEFLHHAAIMDDMVTKSHPHWNGEDIFVNLVANVYYNVPFNGPYNNYALPDLHVWEADTDLYPEKDSKQHLSGEDATEFSISGNMDRNRIWNVGPVTFWKAYVKAQEHTIYRGRFWYRAKRRLAGFKDESN